ncbi:MAG: hypothetical protein U1F16_09580 [Turneriella sp.]
MHKSATLVYNPGSGKKQAAELAERFAAKWRERFADRPLTLEASPSAEHFAELSATANYRKRQSAHFDGWRWLVFDRSERPFAAAKVKHWASLSGFCRPATWLTAFCAIFTSATLIQQSGIFSRHCQKTLLEKARAPPRTASAVPTRAVDSGKFIFTRKGTEHVDSLSISVDWTRLGYQPARAETR